MKSDLLKVVTDRQMDGQKICPSMTSLSGAYMQRFLQSVHRDQTIIESPRGCVVAGSLGKCLTLRNGVLHSSCSKDREPKNVSCMVGWIMLEAGVQFPKQLQACIWLFSFQATTVLA